MSEENYAVSVSELVEIITTATDNPPIIVDLDETIFLRNSTEEYLNTLQPRVLGWLLLTFLNFIKPWNFLPGKIKGDVSRDWVRVVVATLIFPWTLILWQWKAKKLARIYANNTLIQALTQNKNSRVILATNGFGFIVNSLSKHLPITFNDVIACRFWQGATDRRRGKEFLLTEFLGSDEVARSIAVTDSTNDYPLLALVAMPCLVIWQEAKYVPAMADVYIPFLYLERAKRPNKKYFLRVILCDDFLVLILALSWLSSHPILHGISMLFLMLSFWCIYELGYVENDIIAEKFEKKPQLSETYQRYKNRINVKEAWLWAIFFAIPGLIILALSKLIFNQTNFVDAVMGIDIKIVLINMTLWIGFLVVVRSTFWIYNYVDKQTRTWLYFILQIYKSFGFLIITPINVIGVILFASKAICAWIPYFIYRFTKSTWIEDLPISVLQTFLFGFLIITIALGTQNISILINWQTLVILLFCAYRARRQFWKIIRQVHLISQDQWDTTK
jgi:phosphoserine phosphatase